MWLKLSSLGILTEYRDKRQQVVTVQEASGGYQRARQRITHGSP